VLGSRVLFTGGLCPDTRIDCVSLVSPSLHHADPSHRFVVRISPLPESGLNSRLEGYIHATRRKGLRWLSRPLLTADRWQSVRLADIPSWARGYVRCACRLPRTRSIWWSTSLMAPLTSILRPSGPGVVGPPTCYRGAALGWMGSPDQLGVVVITVQPVTRAPRQGFIGGRKSGSNNRHPEVRIGEPCRQVRATIQ